VEAIYLATGSLDVVFLKLCCDLLQLSRGRSSMSGSDVIAWRRKSVLDASTPSFHVTSIGRVVAKDETAIANIVSRDCTVLELWCLWQVSTNHFFQPHHAVQNKHMRSTFFVSTRFRASSLQLRTAGSEVLFSHISSTSTRIARVAISAKCRPGHHQEEIEMGLQHLPN
jgi:hypothetical protein